MFLASVLLLASVPAGAASPAVLPIEVQQRSNVTDITLVYSVDPDQISEIRVSINQQENVLSDYYYENGTLIIVLVTAYEIDTSDALGTITAELAPGASVSEAIVLKELVMNGESCSSNLVPGDVRAAKSGSQVTVSGTLRDDLGGGAMQVFAAAYNSDRKMLACKIIPTEVSDSNTPFSCTMDGCKDAVTVKVMFLQPDSFVPLAEHLTLEILT